MYKMVTGQTLLKITSVYMCMCVSLCMSALIHPMTSFGGQRTGLRTHFFHFYVSSRISIRWSCLHYRVASVFTCSAMSLAPISEILMMELL